MTNQKQGPIAKFRQVGPSPKYDFVKSKPIRAVGLVCGLQRTRTVPLVLAVITFISISLASAQTTTEQVVPSVIKYSGMLADTEGKPLTEPVELTFSLYKTEQGGAALWMESQRVEPDKQGNYSNTRLNDFGGIARHAVCRRRSSVAWGSDIEPSRATSRDVVGGALCHEGWRRGDLGGAPGFSLHANGRCLQQCVDIGQFDVHIADNYIGRDIPVRVERHHQRRNGRCDSCFHDRH